MRNVRVAVIFLCLGLGFFSSAQAKPNHLIVGYSASWFDGIYPPESYNYDAFTHIIRSFLIPKADGTITAQGGYWDPELEKTAHAHGVKLLASLGGAAQNADNWLSMARDPKAEKTFFDNLEKMITDNHYDGVDIDWEPSALTDPDQATYTDFMKALRIRFPNWILTTALGAGDYYGKHISWAEVAKQVDWINWMTYDLAGNWTGHAAHNANLYVSKDFRADLSIDQDLDLKEKTYGLPPEKIVLGIPFYGIRFFTEHMGGAFTGDASKQGSEIQYYEIVPLVGSSKGFQKFWDEGAQVPYLEEKNGKCVISYDDPKSIAIKCDYAVKKGLKGVMIWNIGADVTGANTPLLNTIAKAYGAPVVPMPAAGLAKSIQTFASSVKDTYGKLQAARGKFSAAGKAEDAKAVDPGTLPDLTVPSSQDVKALGKKLWEFQCDLSLLNRKLQNCQNALDSIPVKEVAGQKIPAQGDKVLVDNFEGGGTANALQGVWMTDCDHNNLGTVMNPMPFTPTVGGAPGSAKYAARIWGHYGKSQAPWPYAMLTGTLNAPGTAADLSDFKSLGFQAKGNGKLYSVVMARSAVEDYCNYRLDFKTAASWARVSLNLSDFKQPSWGRQVPYKLGDVLYFAFTPNADFSDEDFDLWVDDITLVK
jgi:chitinase